MILQENEYYVLAGLKAGPKGLPKTPQSSEDAEFFTIIEKRASRPVSKIYDQGIAEEIFEFLSKRKESFEKIKFKRVKRDVNGNPRYVCHYRAFRSEKSGYISYADALKQAKKIGGRKYNYKSFPGGIVFQSYNIAETERLIKENRI